MHRTILIALAVLLAGGLLVRGPQREDGAGDRAAVPAGTAREGVVTRITDGDTIRVRLGAVEEKVRYIGVDTPESVKPGTPVECFAKAASAFNARLVEARRVRLVTDVEERDRYGRLLAYVYRVPDGLFVNAELVRRGYATQLTIPPNVRFAERFRELARAARERGDRTLGGLLRRGPAPGTLPGRMSMRQTLAEFERAFHEQAHDDRRRAEQVVREAHLRQRARHIERTHKHGTMRFVALVLVLLATAVLVTVAMFQALYYVIG